MNSMKSIKSQQSGFTLVEIAIVLVIIGLLLGGILKGQELINSAKGNNLINLVRGLQTQVYAYQDRFKQQPGDDARADTNITGATKATSATLGNGLIEGFMFPPTSDVTGETALIWQHLRLANLATGPTATSDAAYYPLHALNGRMGINTATAGQLEIIGMATGGTQICLQGLPGAFAKRLDAALDDGVSDAGAVRIKADVTPGASTALGTAISSTTPPGVVDGTLYTLCLVY